MSDNLQFWKTFDKPPANALKEIKAGRMSGKTDINPQWRYKAMTETFGPCGIGWKYTVDRKWIEPGAKDEKMAFVDVSVFIKVNNEWSEAIPGTGGSTLVAAEKSGFYNDDDAYKKALTDALSVAMKMLGVASEIYAGGWDGTKYRADASEKKQEISEESPVTAANIVSVGWVKEIPHANQLINLLGISKWQMGDAKRLYAIYHPWRVYGKLEPAAAAAKAQAGEIYQPKEG